MASVLFVTGEMTPFCSSGGLGEVSEALPLALHARGHDVTVVLPLYASIDRTHLAEVDRFAVRLAWRNSECVLFETVHRGVRVCFLDAPFYYGRPRLYGDFDDGERFAFFCAAVMALIPRLPVKPEVLHLNDWQCALCLPYLKLLSKDHADYRGIFTVYTIHNIAYRGVFSPAILGDVFGLSEEEGAALIHGDHLDLCVGAIRLCDRLTTVSPTYAREITEDHAAPGIAPILRANAYKLIGIRNGIDVAHYRPARGGDGITPFSAEDPGGKEETKRAFLSEFFHTEDTSAPLVAIISRLVHDKGLDLVASAFPHLMERGARLVILGSGEGQYEAFFRMMEEKYLGQVRAVIGFDRSLSRRIYAASDFLLMPSRLEACGVSQMIASLCGTLPIVHLAGGLYDTVLPYNAPMDEGDGFGFTPFSAEALCHVYDLAMNVYYENKDAFMRLRFRAMKRDRSWDAPAALYEKVYEAQG